MPGESEWLTVLQEYQPEVWLLAIAFYGVGDTVTTILGLRAEHTAEVGPVALLFIEHGGVAGLLLLKVLFFAGCFLAWYLLSTPSRIAIPLAVAVAGAGVTVWNLIMLFG